MTKIDDCKSYATEANLLKALERFSLINENPIVVRNREGRWTAIFSIAQTSMRNGGYLGFASQHGFMTVN